MDGLTLLAEARLAGLTVRAEEERLLIRGPREQEHLAKRLLSHKAELLGAMTRASFAARSNVISAYRQAA